MRNDPPGIGVLIISANAKVLVNSKGDRVVKADDAIFIRTGDQVFVIGGKYRHGSIEYWINTGKFRLSDVGKLGKTVFLTNEEAEAKIAEWKAKKYDPTYDPQWESEDEE